MHPGVKWSLFGVGLAGAGIGGFFVLRAAGIAGALPRAQGDSFLVNTVTLTSSKQDFVRAVMSAGAAADGKLGPATRALLASWAALESGWGKTRQAKLGWNVYNVSKGSWTGPVLPGGDTEYKEGEANARTITQMWRQYGNLTAAINDVLNLLRTSRFVNYREAYEDLIRGDERFATRLGVFERSAGAGSPIVRVDTRPNSAGFYTLPRSEYQKHVSALYRDVQTIIAGMNVPGLMSGTQS